MSSGPAVIVLSDDLTGTTGAGAEARRRVDAVQIVRWDAWDAATECDVLIVDTHSRLLSDAAAAERISRLTADIMSRYGHAPLYYKRVDSQLRGAVSAEARAWAGVLGLPLVLATAAPGLEIITRGGRQEVRGHPVTATTRPGDHPRVGGPIGIPATAPELLRPSEPDFNERVATAAARGHDVAVDIATVRDLHLSAAAVAAARNAGRRTALIGSYGFLGAYLDAIGSRRGGAGVLIVSDSLKHASRAQIARYADEGGELLVLGSCPDSALASAAIVALGNGRDIAVASVAPDLDDVVADPTVSARLADLVAHVLEQVVLGGMIAMGGEFASRLIDRLGTERLDVVSEPWPATPVVRLRGGVSPGLVAVFQSGSQGEPDRILRIANAIRGAQLTDERNAQ